MGASIDPKLLRPACRLAVTVAGKGELADPRVPAPVELRPVLGFTRLSSAAYGVIARVVEDDGIFRARVAEAAEESAVGRAGWLWLHRPVDWALDPVFGGPGSVERPAPTPAPKRDEKAATVKLRKQLADAEAARRRAVDQLAELRRVEAEVRADRDRLAALTDSLQEERNAAVRRSKSVEANLAETRRDLKVAREATRQAEAELEAARSVAATPAASVAPIPPSPAPKEASVVATPRPLDTAALDRAAQAAGELAAALADAAIALAAPPAAVPAAAEPVEPLEPVPTNATPKKRAKKAKRSERVAPVLPPGVFDGTADAHRHLITAGANLVVVDGYNVARAAWLGLTPEEERRRTVALLDDVQARSGGRVVVIFDGDDAVTAPKASKNVRVRFSATGQTADDAITDLLADTPVTQPVVVVSSDRAVVADAKRHGAVSIGARAFLTAAGR